MHQSLQMSVGAVAAIVALATAGCGGSDQSSSSARESASSTAAPVSSTTTASSAAMGADADYSSLLIKPTDVGPDVTADGPPVANPGGNAGIGGTFKTPDDRALVVTVAVFPDAAAAAAMIQPMKDTIAQKINGQQQAVDVGSNGFMVAGPAPQKSTEISEVVFTQGRALVDLEYDSALGNPTPSDVVLDVARKQAAAVSAGLPA